ncbi:MAG: ADP-ribosylglycohydrolase family protein [Candidatus Syntrophonatronum acetioxidans]|uniref:ADP-ribosylglycohydrolase family protein n=1 Tax=Candidatus Syntrophonatronum acetioxidans TaxID=1795816 RepID=A0A424YBP7_9FIRM|nr:MAG: ADP-ribosylglycohydrolase family protein [Candidatus Syntrophonatronum acetioxidans]
MGKKENKERIRGCLIGGAIGDALGWPVEFLKTRDIERKFGPGGIQDLQLSPSGKAEITDDTQMTLFTAEGVLRSETRAHHKGITHPPSVVFFAYQRWLVTQGHPRCEDYLGIYDGWLIEVKELYAQRAPGRTCISALRSRKKGTIEEPQNDSKGCGGVMRVSPAGLLYRGECAFKMAAEFAALTHGHPSGYLSGGALASIISSIMEGKDMEKSIKDALTELESYPHHHECGEKLKEALNLAHSTIPAEEAIYRLGQGWVGEEALAISAYCALKYQEDFQKALIAAVNHDGDSDSTGSVTGNILGAYLGLSNIPASWIEKVELRDILMQVADDLDAGFQEGDEWWERYPGY